MGRLCCRATPGRTHYLQQLLPGAQQPAPTAQQPLSVVQQLAPTVQQLAPAAQQVSVAMVLAWSRFPKQTVWLVCETSFP